MKIAVLKCKDCGTVLNETKPFPPEKEGLIRMGSPMMAGQCPKGCRSTFSDLNMNTTLEISDVPDDQVAT